MGGFYSDYDRVPPADSTVVSWLPFYHDMGLLLGVCAPILDGWRTIVMSPWHFWRGLPGGCSRSAAIRADRGTQLRVRPRGGPHHRRRSGRM